MSDETPHLSDTNAGSLAPRHWWRPGRRGAIVVTAVAVVLVAGGVTTAVAVGVGDGRRGHDHAERGDRARDVAGQQVIGTVTSIGSSTLSVTSAGSSKTYAVTSDTRVISSGGSAALSGLKSGDAVVVVVDSTTTISGNAPAAAVYSGTLPAVAEGRSYDQERH